MSTPMLVRYSRTIHPILSDDRAIYERVPPRACRFDDMNKGVKVDRASRARLAVLDIYFVNVDAVSIDRNLESGVRAASIRRRMMAFSRNWSSDKHEPSGIVRAMLSNTWAKSLAVIEPAVERDVKMSSMVVVSFPIGHSDVESTPFVERRCGVAP